MYICIYVPTCVYMYICICLLSLPGSFCNESSCLARHRIQIHSGARTNCPLAKCIELIQRHQELFLCPTPSGWWALAFPINRIGWRGPANCRTGSPAWCLRLPVAWASLWANSSLLSNSNICCSVHFMSLNTKLWRQTSDRYLIWFKTLSLVWKNLRQMGQNNKSPR